MRLPPELRYRIYQLVTIPQRIAIGTPLNDRIYEISTVPYYICVVDRIQGLRYSQYKPNISPNITPLYLVCRQLHEETALLPLGLSRVVLVDASAQASYLFEYTLTNTQRGAIQHLCVGMKDVQYFVKVLLHSCMPKHDGPGHHAHLQRLCFPPRRLTGLKKVTVRLIGDTKEDHPDLRAIVNLPREIVRAIFGIAPEVKLNFEYWSSGEVAQAFEWQFEEIGRARSR